MQHKREIKYSSDNGQPWESDMKTSLEASAKDSEVIKGNPGELIYGRNLKWYQDAALWPMFILLLLEIGLRVVQTKYFSASEPMIFSWLVGLARLSLFSYLAFSAIRQFKATARQVMTAAVLGGLVVGFIMALFQLVWYFELWTLFNLIGQPLVMALEGLVISWLIIRLFYFKKIKQ